MTLVNFQKIFKLCRMVQFAEKYFEFFKGKKRIFQKLLRMMPEALKKSDRGLDISIFVFFLLCIAPLYSGVLPWLIQRLTVRPPGPPRVSTVPASGRCG